MIMSCVISVSYSVLCNQEPTGYIIPSRVLSQGDPLSPYLFLLCVDGLIVLLKTAEHRKHITGVIVGRGPKLTHLLFADDSFLFCRADTKECQNIMRLLGTYEGASCHKINTEKTSLFFSSNTPFEVQS
jgi:hypothetical protein